MEHIDLNSFEREFEEEIAKDDDSAAREIWATGDPIHVSREDTPPGHVVRIHPGGREELARVDFDELAAVLGR